MEKMTPETKIAPFANFPVFKTSFYHDTYSWRGVKVLTKTEDSLTLKMYNLQQYHRDFPRTYSHAVNILFSLLEIAGTASEWQKFAAVFDLKKDHLTAARRLIRSFEISGFENLIYNNNLWEETKKYEFDENLPSDIQNSLMQATLTIRVTDPGLLETIEPGATVKLTEYLISPLWYLENKTTGQFYALYSSEGGKWLVHEGEIGSEGIRKPTKGISKGYYKLQNERAENYAFEKLKEGYELVYRNFDTKYNLEEEIEERLRKEQNDEGKADASEEAFEYIKNKDIEKLKALLETGVHPDALKDDYSSALRKAARTWSTEAVDLEIFKLLLAHGANPDQGDSHPLLQEIAAHSRTETDDEMVRCLVNAGADIRVISGHPGYHKSSALQSACYGGMLWFVEYLLENGADIHYQDTEGQTALNYAVRSRRNSAEIITLLLQYGADINDLLKLDSHGSNAFENAETPETIEKIASLGIDINRKNNSGYPGIWKASEYGSAEIFETYLKLNAAVDLYNILHRITFRIRNIGGKETIESNMKKFKSLHGRGHDISVGDTFDWIYKSFINRKKIAKFEEQALIELWEMGCRPNRMVTFQEYAQKVNSARLLELVDSEK